MQRSRATSRLVRATGVKEALAKAKRRAQIDKPGGIHLLRHSFATHLIEAREGRMAIVAVIDRIPRFHLSPRRVEVNDSS